MRLDEQILFIDGEAIVIDKPAGLPVDAPRDGALSVASYGDLLRFGFERRPQAVHRLDRDTSGCLLLARNPRAQRRFAAQWEAGEVRKTYVAIVDGVPAGEGGTVDLALEKVSTRDAGWRMRPDPRGKPALTRWRLLAVADGRALLALTPETGRTHQLRVHCASGLGTPIAGDAIYGRGGAGMMLHAFSLAVPRPPKPPVAVTSPWPARFSAAGFPAPPEFAHAAA